MSSHRYKRSSLAVYLFLPFLIPRLVSSFPSRLPAVAPALTPLTHSEAVLAAKVRVRSWRSCSVWSKTRFPNRFFRFQNFDARVDFFFIVRSLEKFSETFKLKSSFREDATSPGSVVMGGYPFSEGRGLEYQHRILDGIF